MLQNRSINEGNPYPQVQIWQIHLSWRYIVFRSGQRIKWVEEADVVFEWKPSDRHRVKKTQMAQVWVVCQACVFFVWRSSAGYINIKSPESGDRSGMACFHNLKQDIRRLEAAFPKGHKCFQLISATVDEVVCRFVPRSGKKCDIFANFTVSHNLLLFYSLALLTLVPHYFPLQETYPEMPPVWFSESEETFVSTVIQTLSESDGPDNFVSHTCPDPVDLISDPTLSSYFADHTANSDVS